MGKLGTLSGVPVLVIIYVSNLFLTNFGLPMYLAYALLLAYGSFYIVTMLNSGHGLNSGNKNLFLLHFALLAYGLIIFLLFEIGFLSRESPSWWSVDSFAKFLSIMIASITVIVTPIDRVTHSILIIKNISYLMIFGSVFYYLFMPFGWGFFSSDFLAGHRYNGGINSYIIAGQFLIAGFVAHVLFNQKASPVKLFTAVACFGFGIVATNDRTSMGSLLIIFGILWFRSGFGVSPFIFQSRKSLILLFLVPITLFLAISQYQNVVSGSIESYKSSLHRLTISIRSYELFQEVFPIGAGPGSQTFLMNETKIKAEFLEGDTKGDDLTGLITKEISGFQAKVGKGFTMSPHNTYVDFLVPFGAMGLFFVLCILRVQLGAVKRLFFDKNNPTVIVDAFAVSGLLFLMFSSLFNLWWIYLIYYRMLISKK